MNQFSVRLIKSRTYTKIVIYSYLENSIRKTITLRIVSPQKTTHKCLYIPINVFHSVQNLKLDHP